jgi:hypothetical protein
MFCRISDEKTLQLSLALWTVSSLSSCPPKSGEELSGYREQWESNVGKKTKFLSGDNLGIWLDAERLKLDENITGREDTYRWYHR